MGKRQGVQKGRARATEASGAVRAGEAALLEEGLSGMHEALGSSPAPHNQGVRVDSSDSSAGCWVKGSRSLKSCLVHTE